MRILSFSLFGLLVVLLGFLSITVYDFYFAESEILAGFQKDTGPLINLNISDEYPEGILFYDNLRFSKDSLSYSISGECNEDRAGDSREAFEILDDITILSFTEKEINGDIRVICSEKEVVPDSDYFIAGEGGPNGIVNTTHYYVATNGTIFLYHDGKCSKPVVAIHEILHVLGFTHSTNKQSIMYDVSNCKQKITSAVIDTINLVYSTPSLPDLIISEVSAEKKGRYLSFEVEILNVGLDYSFDSVLGIYGNGILIAEYDIEPINAGAGRILKVSNLKALRSLYEVKFVVDDKEQIFEINEDNNFQRLSL